VDKLILKYLIRTNNSLTLFIYSFTFSLKENVVLYLYNLINQNHFNFSYW